MGLREAYRWGEILKSLYGGQATRRWDYFLWVNWTPPGTMHRFLFGNWGRDRLDEMG